VRTVTGNETKNAGRKSTILKENQFRSKGIDVSDTGSGL
jgi:hypothetical protein